MIERKNTPRASLADAIDNVAKRSSVQIAGCDENLRHFAGDAFHDRFALDFLTKERPCRNNRRGGAGEQNVVTSLKFYVGALAPHPRHRVECAQ